MIRTFRNQDTAKVFRREFCRRFQAIAAVAKRKLDHIHASASLLDLGAIPGHQLEALKGDRTGQFSIRINDQYRICFIWKAGEAHEVEITDYH